MTFPQNPGPATQSTGNVAGGPYGAWANSAGTALIGPTGGTVVLGGGPGGGVALYDGANSITSGTAQFSNSNGVSFGFNGQTITGSVASQTVQTQASGAIAGSGFTTTTTAGTAIVGTHNSGGLSLGVPVYITTATQSAQTGISSIADNAHTQSVGMLSFANSNGVTFGLSTGAVTATITASVVGGNPGISSIADSANTQTVGMLSFANSNGITWGISTGANTATLTASFNSAGLLSNINISGGASSANVSAVTFSNLNGVTFGYDKTNITASINSTSGAGLGTTFNGANISGSMTLNTAGLNLSLSGGAGGGTNPTTVSYYQNFPYGAINNTNAAAANTIFAGANMWLVPFVVSVPISFYRGMMIEAYSTAATVITYPRIVSNSAGSTTASGSQGDTYTFALFSRVSTGTNANSSNLISFTSTSCSRTFGVGVTYSNNTNASTASATVSYQHSYSYQLANMDSAGNYTTGSVSFGTSSSASTTSAAQTTVSSSAAYTNPYAWGANIMNVVDIPLPGSLSPGEYWMGIAHQSTSTSTAFYSGGATLVSNWPGLWANTWAGQVPIYNFGASHGSTAAATFMQQGLGRSYGTGGTTTTFAVSSGTDSAPQNPWFALLAETK